MVPHLNNIVAGDYVSMVQNEQFNDRTEMIDCLDSFINISTDAHCNNRSWDI